MKKKLLNRSQAWWFEFLSRFDNQHVYRLGKLNGKADALTRWPGNLPEGGDERLNNLELVVLELQNLLEQLCLLADRTPAQGHPSISDLMTEAYATDPLPRKIMEAIQMISGLRELLFQSVLRKMDRYDIGTIYMFQRVTVCAHSQFRKTMIQR